LRDRQWNGSGDTDDKGAIATKLIQSRAGRRHRDMVFKFLDEIFLTGPTSQYLLSEARKSKKALTEPMRPNTWQHTSVSLLYSCLQQVDHALSPFRRKSTQDSGCRYSRRYANQDQRPRRTEKRYCCTLSAT